MKVYSAKYDPSYNTADNSLVANMLKYPEIAKKIIELYPRYSMTYLLERLGFGASEKVIGANAFEWKTMERYKQPAVLDVADSTDRNAGDVVTYKIASAEAAGEYCHLSVNDVVRIDTSGTTGLVTAVGTVNTGADGQTDVTIKLLQGFNDNLTTDTKFGVIGSAFGQGYH